MSGRLGSDRKKSKVLMADDSSGAISVSDDSEAEGKADNLMHKYKDEHKEKSGKPCPRATFDNGLFKNKVLDNRGLHFNPQQKEDMEKTGRNLKLPPKEKIGAVEVFCGCARMSKELKAAGFDAVRVDYSRNKGKPETKSYVELDLSKEWGVKELYKIIKEKNVKITFSAPPCGSAARCR